MVVNRLVRALNRQAVAVGRDADAALLQRPYEGITIGVDLDEDRLRFLREVPHVPGLHQPATLQHNDAITRALDVRHEVRREEHADSELPVRLSYEGEHLFAAQGIQARRGLVEKHECRVMHQRLPELDPLFHPGRIAPDRPIPLLEKPGVPERVGGPRARDRRRQAARFRHVREELGRAHLRGQAIVFGHVPQPATNTDGPGGVLAEDDGTPRRRLDQSQEDLDRGALARAILAEDARDPVMDVEADLVQGNDIPVLFRQAFGRQQRLARRHDEAFRPGQAGAWPSSHARRRNLVTSSGLRRTPAPFS